MTPNEIEKLAGHRTVSPWIMKLVLDAVELEREACAKVCEKLHNGSLEEFGTLIGEIYNENCAAAIRARGNNVLF